MQSSLKLGVTVALAAAKIENQSGIAKASISLERKWKTRAKKAQQKGETCQILILFFASKGRAAKKRPTSEILWLKRKILALMPRHLWFWDIYLALQFLIKTLAWLSEILRVDRMGNFCSLGQEKKEGKKKSLSKIKFYKSFVAFPVRKGGDCSSHTAVSSF